MSRVVEKTGEPPLYLVPDPDGSLDAAGAFGLLALIPAPTGVVYAHQCAGHRTVVREAEGFLIPVGGLGAADAFVGAGPLVAFFARAFRGNPPDPQRPQDGTWSEAHLRELTALVGAIPCWLTPRAIEGSRRLFLELDTDRLAELTGGWIPVLTPHGPGVLLFPNSD
jgi:Family of unknown function (DUF6210)